ncbi:MAG: hypothetical protein ACRELV_12150 [Longimicrobiales bacterium]
MAKHEPTVLDRARDELFSHIHRCGVLDADQDQQGEWLRETLEFMAERYPSLNDRELAQLREIGTRFCSPVIPHGPEGSAAMNGAANEAATETDEANEDANAA